MINIIRIAVKFDNEPSLIFLDTYSSRLITAVDDYCNNRQRSYITEEPSKEQKDKGDFVYRWEIEVGDCSVNVHDLFDVVNPIPGGKVLLVDVRDKKYDPKYNNCNVGYYWTNEGCTWYHDSNRSYVDCYYKFHANGNTDYEIVHMPSYLDKLTPREQKKWQDAGSPTYMWRCTSCWDNWLKAETIEEAIEEFEEIYREQLWKSVEGYQKGLDRATTAFKQFDEYQRNKK